MPVRVANSHFPKVGEHSALCIEKPVMNGNRPPKRLVIGLLNNMSVSALDATERQFAAILDSASAGIDIELKRFVLPEILESESTSIYRDRNYESSESLGSADVDGLIVTGREPMTPELRHEPYWDSFVQALEWAQNETVSTIWSCLAAHAAVLHLDGIRRVRSEQKHSGIYNCTRVSDHPIAAGMPLQFCLPHSRWNGLREADIMRAGYEVITQTEGGEVDCFLRQGKSLFVFFQGHPEYQAETLLLEYRRDVGRFLRGEATNYPCIPYGYFDRTATRELTAIQLRAIEDRREDTLAQIAAVFSTAETKNGWHSAASRFYRNWLGYISSQKMSHSEMNDERVTCQSGSEADALQSTYR
jgi:homoserine O-succinyltransferase/O-acetyltransferase